MRDKHQQRCRKGHVLAGDNLYHSKNGRRCKTCARARATRQQIRRKTAHFFPQPYTYLQWWWRQQRENKGKRDTATAIISGGQDNG